MAARVYSVYPHIGPAARGCRVQCACASVRVASDSVCGWLRVASDAVSGARLGSWWPIVIHSDWWSRRRSGPASRSQRGRYYDGAVWCPTLRERVPDGHWTLFALWPSSLSALSVCVHSANQTKTALLQVRQLLQVRTARS